jgi:hypothetical protein
MIMEKSREQFFIADRFNLIRKFSKYAIEFSIGLERPDIALKSQQIHGKSYVDFGYITPDALTEDGRIITELDGTRGDDEKIRATYLVAYENGKCVNEAGASVRLLDVTPSGSIADLPTCKYFNGSNLNIPEKIQRVVDSSPEAVNIREIAALSSVSFPDNQGSYELMRAVMQNSLIKKSQHDISEQYLVSLTEKSLKPVIRLAGSKAVEILGEPVRVYAGDPRQKEVYVTPVLLNPNKAIEGIIDELDTAKNNREIAILKQKLIFLTDGLNVDEAGGRAIDIFNESVSDKLNRFGLKK